ncbi:FMN-dependent NADH-azoreductase [Pseudomonas synxantha]|uniref:FMN dependent NADH:quinone oxidoreductase n=1 Tax=Pseudomonas synxantha TaxID=47883 RepID=A0ABS0UL77_9PSED|nr:NAD(P)H-dependent oxidoreductase [Pseudomonas synxantha]AZE78090.1 FMN-dependent NADH-azoreductase [Pseudomonas synxantha]MBI6566332.1 NAD(P)H-dependent oxidoreductase [Pseudomonas synxantha]MBI6578900.1 NAD(P)H-dependent oxidoreductase [Pseudomonas synxantha]MBI6645276.1 NAD(P)H-dependent oxidoreductase [Pseudomonas synxantha]
MPRLLSIETSPRGAASISRQLTRRFVAAWEAAHPAGTVKIRDLTDTPLRFVEAPWLQAYFKPESQHSPEMKTLLQLSDQLVAELLETDHLVISTPVYNYNVPAALKAWVDHVVRKGLTLGFDGKGLVTGKKATVLIASGGVYSGDSPIRERDIASQYLKLILNVLGITDITFIAAGGAKAVDLGEISMQDFLAGFDDQIQAALA